jgi:hypothetical protein
MDFYFGKNSGNSARSALALYEVGAPFEAHPLDLRKPRSPEYLALNPLGKVPTLIDGVTTAVGVERHQLVPRREAGASKAATDDARRPRVGAALGALSNLARVGRGHGSTPLDQPRTRALLV